MADDSGDEIYVDVVPRLDEAAAEEAVGKLEGKFKDVTTSLGKNITSATSDAFRDMGTRMHGWGEDLAGQLGESFGDHLGRGDFGGIFSGLGKTITDALSPARDIGDSLGGVFDNLKSGNVTDGLGGLSDVLKNIGGGNFDALSGTLDKLSGSLGSLSSLPDTIKAALSGDLSQLVNLPGGGQGTAIPQILDHAGDMGADIAPSLGAAAFMGNAVPQFNQWANGNSMFHQYTHPQEWWQNPIGAGVGGFMSLQDRLAQMAGFAPPGGGDGSMSPEAKKQYQQFMGQIAQGNAKLPADIGGGAGLDSSLSPHGPFSGTAGNAGALPSSMSTNAMSVSAGTVNINGSVSIPGMAGSGHSVASSGAGSAGSSASLPRAAGPHVSSGSAGTAGTSGKLGFFTGGILPGSSPGYDNMLGILPSGMAVGLEGGEGVINAAAMAHPGVADLVSHLNGYAGGTGPGGIEGPLMPSLQNPERPARPGPPTNGPNVNVVGGGPSRKGPESETPHGTGKGFGIGGGLIGAAEGAAAMAASMTPAGPAGGMAVQIASQEINRAAAYGGQVAGILGIEMPLDTLSVRGNKLSNLAKSLPGKIGMGIVGSHNFSESLAGNTQPPLQPKQEQSNPVGGAPNRQQPAINIENMHVGNTGQGAEMEQHLNRYANAAEYTSAYPA